MIRTLAATLAASTCIVALPAPGAAQTREYNIPAGSLKSALDAYVRQSGREVVYRADEVRTARSPGARGQLSADAALANLLAGSGFATRLDGNLIAIVKAGNDVAAVSMVSSEEETILVTGTRIRGADTPSPVVRVTEEGIREAGFNDLGEVIRSIPQNFAGGQNPGIALGSGNNTNLTGGSALNLRGLGPDATLTLLNGRRLSYGGFQQAVDASLVPIAALQRIEIITDGASALYGSDAVAGVANIILKRDFDGLTTAGRLGFATDGGGTERQLSATAGTTWRDGGFIAAYNYLDADPIFSDQRSYTEYMLDPSTLLPKRRNHNALVSAHQRISEALEFSIDGLYTDRYFRLSSAQPAQLSVSMSKSTVYAVSPMLELSLPTDWTVTVGGTYSVEENIVTNEGFSSTGALLVESVTCYCNKAYSFEASGEGPLFQLPAGAVRLAAGAGYRNNEYTARRPATGQILTSGDVGSRYAFGEINLPIVAPAMAVPLIRRLSATAAIRHESYSAYGSITTPKLGIIYQPTSDLTLKGSWGRSFKAPTLNQRFSDYLLYLRPASTAGGTAFPATATVLMPYGGNPDLEPEKARTWSLTLSAQPRALPGLTFDVSYFDIDYRGRVILPITNFQTALSDPALRPFVTLYPTAQQIADAVAPAVQIINATTQPLTPETVVAIINNQYSNVARQRAKGVDLSGTYDFTLAGGRAAVQGSASWLSGDQQAIPGQPAFPTAGIVYNPAKFRARGGVVWRSDRVMVSGFVNHVASVTDNRFATGAETGSFTTADAVVRYQTGPGDSVISDLDISVSAQNILNKKPPLYQPLANFIVNYDSTNYSAIGRYISLSISKSW
ncbi:TonB-dependent receptor plug domain-containing protein [Sphingomonas sp. ACRSK]|uniref:TonB-dependent receptor plug domain-containing protein n=1 Tax=Sphingomonas sp. ACRSK TaxID=2918213 RepID=UPI001EF4B53B|nr:TonB-dependent receptor [Sphingomonas sp. ACRSK]MCG7349858.1 TonB-dependent receptor [Sphingomonas sp. ACRSK]